MLNLSTEGDAGIFYTVQGEGKFVGYPTVFVRLSGCNLRCAWKNKDGTLTTCDTPHTSFNPEKNNKMDVGDIVDKVLAHNCKHVVITGGEPYFQKEVVELIDCLYLHDKHVTVETNGTIFRSSLPAYHSISLKLSSSSAHPELGAKHEKQRFKLESILEFVRMGSYQFKFVVNDENDEKEIMDIVAQIEKATEVNISEHIWIMPQGISAEQLDAKMLWAIDLCKKHGWKLSDRLHIRIWGHQKGV